MLKNALDEIDRKILNLLQTDARIANVDLAEQVGLSPSPCARRVKGLEEGNTISRYVTLINQKQVGLPVSVFISVTLEKQVEKSLEDFEHFKYRQSLLRNLWVGMVVLLSALYLGQWD